MTKPALTLQEKYLLESALNPEAYRNYQWQYFPETSVHEWTDCDHALSFRGDKVYRRNPDKPIFPYVPVEEYAELWQITNEMHIYFHSMGERLGLYKLLTVVQAIVIAVLLYPYLT